MIPKSASVELETQQNQPSLTYGLDFEKGIIKGQIDGLEAVEQAILLMLSTERFEYVIHSWNYGVEFGAILGSSSEFIYLEIEQYIREALIIDDRIESVETFQFTRSKNSILVSFVVKTIYGDLSTEREVSI